MIVFLKKDWIKQNEQLKNDFSHFMNDCSFELKNNCF